MEFTSVGDGILNTPVTADDLQDIIHRTFGDSANFGPNVKFSIVGEKSGMFSRIILIDPDWRTPVPKFAPKQLIAKISSMAGLMEAMAGAQTDEQQHLSQEDFNIEEYMKATEGNLRKLHNTEVMVYDWLIKSKLEIPMCKVYYSKSFSAINQTKGLILMEYLTDVTPVQIWEKFKLKELYPILQAKAKMECFMNQLNDNEKAKFTFNPFFDMLPGFVNSQTNEMQFMLLEKYCNDDIRKLIAKIREMGGCFYDYANADGIWKRLGMKAAFNHGDLWMNNIMMKRHEDGSLKLRALIDFQMAYYGCPATDLVFLIITTLSGKDRREHWEELLAIFYGYLKEEYGQEEMPYTFEQLKASYVEFFPNCGIITCSMLGSYMSMAIETAPDDETKHAIEASMTEYIQALLEDTISGQEELNQKKNA